MFEATSIINKIITGRRLQGSSPKFALREQAASKFLELKNPKHMLKQEN